MTLQGCHGNQEDLGQLERIFIDAVVSIEANKEFQEEFLLGIDAVKELILERNPDLIPFQKYTMFKYGNSKI